MDIVTLAEHAWQGENDSQGHPVTSTGDLVEIANDVAFMPTFGNCSVVGTDDGLFMVDCGSAFVGEQVFQQVRNWSPRRLNTLVYSHGHIDHVGGVERFETEASSNGWPAVRVVAHENVATRFDRYVMTGQYNQVVNRRQFGMKDLIWPVNFRYPDVTYTDQLDLSVGSLRVHLQHEKGETDDATATWIESKALLITGDFFIWTSPNAGNPQKVQRYPLEWAKALRNMARLGAETMLPGHGLPIFGRDRIRQALDETAEYLESIVDQTLEMMNNGERLSDIVSTVKPPSHLVDRPFLRAIYDEPEFIVHNVWRLYGGWWDANPASLKPANDRVVAREVAQLSGGARRLALRAQELLDEGSSDGERLAGHLIEFAWLSDPDDPEIVDIRNHIFTVRAKRATSTMAKGVFRWAARESTGEKF